MEYTIFILALPVLSFLVLALAGMKMPHKVAGAIGTLSLAAVTVLSYITAVGYFTAQRTAEGLLPVSTPWNFRWLPFHAGSYLGDDAGGYLYRVAHGAHLFVRIYERGTRIPALLRFPLAVYLLNAGTGGGYQHLPDVRVLGACGRFVISAHRLLLHQA